MDKLNFNNLNIKPPFDIDAYDKKQLDLLIDDPMLLKFLSEHQFSIEDVKSNIPLFKKLLDDLKTCKSCQGLDSCSQSSIGYLSILKKEPTIDWHKMPCKYQKANLKFLNKQNMYKFKPFTQDLMNVTMDKITLFEDNSSYMRAYDKVLDYCSNYQGKGLYLWGPCGVGKTYLMLCVTNYFASQNKTVAFVNVPELVMKCKSKIDYELVNTIIDVDFAVFDDIGQETVTTLSRDELLFSILNERMLTKKPTCFTSNFDFNKLKINFSIGQYGDSDPARAERVVERVRALSTEVQILGKSLR